MGKMAASREEYRAIRTQAHSLRIARHLIGQYKTRSLIVILSFLAAGIAEALGTASLLPLFSFFSESGTVDNTLNRYIMKAFQVLGLEIRLEVIMGGVLVLIALKSAFLMVAMRNIGFATASMANSFRVNMIRALMHAQWRYFQSMPAGKVANAMSTEADRAAQCYMTFCKIISESIVVLFYLVLTSLISWHLTVMACIVGGAVMAVLYRFVRMVKEGGKAQTKHMSNLSVLITDSIGAVKIIKAMGRTKYFINLLKQDSRAVRDAKKRQIIGNQFLIVIREPVFATIAVMGMYAAHEYANLPMVSILTFAFMFLRIAQKITDLQVTYQRQIANESAYWAMTEKIQDAEKQRELWSGKRKNLTLDQSIAFRNVSYSHNPDDVGSVTLNDISVIFPAKKMSVVVGTSGAGKTTLIDLILGFYKPHKGDIKIDGVNLQEADLQDWRGSVGYVPQECPLLHDTIYHNITMGQDDYTEEDVRQALEAAGAWHFVQAQPNGIYEQVGERGQRFSGGERQRIAIARALISKPKLLLLDEATSALDKDTEREFMSMIKSLSHHVTVIAITHNPNVLKYADIALRIDKGVIRQQET